MKFLKQAIRLVQKQTYPKNRIEWIILDDSPESNETLFKNIPYAKYVYVKDKMTIGAKRNKLNELATGDIIVAWDDDDYYPPTRISHAVTRLMSNLNHKIVGSSEMYLYFTDCKEIWRFEKMGEYHATNGTFAYWKEFTNGRSYDETVTHAEEREYLDGYTCPMTQLESLKTILVLCHDKNTYDKNQLRGKSEKLYKTHLKLKKIIKDKEDLKFYTNL